MSDTWKPINTIPKDKRVLICSMGTGYVEIGHLVEVFFTSGKRKGQLKSRGVFLDTGRLYDPALDGGVLTHWHPLPKCAVPQEQPLEWKKYE